VALTWRVSTTRGEWLNESVGYSPQSFHWSWVDDPSRNHHFQSLREAVDLVDERRIFARVRYVPSDGSRVLLHPEAQLLVAWDAFVDAMEW
jgi:hypothetical protein